MNQHGTLHGIKHLKHICLLFMLVLTGCGFALQGSNQQSQLAIPALTLVTAQQEAPMVRLLREKLSAAGVDLQLTSAVSSADNLQLQLGAEEFDIRIVAVTSRAGAAQYELIGNISFAVTQADNTLSAPETVSAQRTYFEDIANIAGSAGEAELLRDEIREELANRIIRRLEVIIPR
ncbi:MAG: LPS assembly lipoprotein LptE [Pseudomonadales bacterium]|nr:LPS assembly lipoprotein LptE [Pseudomonadales bacterium]